MTWKAKLILGLFGAWLLGFFVTPSWWLVWLIAGVCLGLYLTWLLERETPVERRLRRYSSEWSRTRCHSVKSRPPSAPQVGPTARRRYG